MAGLALGACSGAPVDEVAETGAAADTAAAVVTPTVSGSTAGLAPDLDHDGVAAPADCDDADPAVFPGAEERCGDGVVNDCARVEAGWTKELCAQVAAPHLQIIATSSSVNEGAALGDLRGDGSFFFGLGVPSATDCSVIGTDEWGEELWECHQFGGFYLLELGALRPTHSEHRLVLPSPDSPGVFGVGGHLPDRSYGSSLEGLGDFDGDGYTDFVLGNNQGAISETDEVWLFWGPEVPARFDEGTRLYLSGETGRCIGYDMERAGDLTGDGIDDMVVGDPCRDEAWIWSGADVRAATGDTIEPVARVLHSADGTIELGMALSGRDDLTGDGVADLIVSAPNTLERDRVDRDFVGVYEGPFAGDRDASDRVATVRSSLVAAEWSEHTIGATIDVGDLNGDGYADLVVADPGWYDHPGGGTAGNLTTAYMGPLSGDYVDTEAAVQIHRGGGEVEARTDFDGDGRADVLVGSGSYSREGGLYEGWGGAGYATLMYAPLAGVVTDPRVDADVMFRCPLPEGSTTTPAACEQWGSQVIAVPDQTGDGVPDALIGTLGDYFWLMPVPRPNR